MIDRETAGQPGAPASEMPDNDPATLRALTAQAARVRAVFEGANYEPVDPPVLQPADVFLDRSGENIRRRMYLFADPSGAELCLRPDLTIPTCRLFLARNPSASGDTRLSYQGSAFRYQTHAPWPRREFTQIGIERFGASDAEAADAEAMALAIDAVRAAGLSDFRIEMGDLGLFGALVDVLDMPTAWRGRLKRHFWRPDYFRDLVERLVEGRAPSSGGVEQVGLFSALEALDGNQSRAFIEEVLDLAGISPVGGRSVGEIAERLLEQAADAGAQAISTDVAELISDFLKVDCAPANAVEKIHGLTRAAAISIEPQLEKLTRRLDLIEANGIDLSAARFSTGFGRNMEYYTGFVFELCVAAPEGKLDIAGGGRYDGLLKSLGAPNCVPAVGCALIAERLLRAVRLENREDA